MDESSLQDFIPWPVSTQRFLALASQLGSQTLWQHHVVPALSKRQCSVTTLLSYRRVYEQLLTYLQESADPLQQAEVLTGYQQWLTERNYHHQTIRKRLSMARVLVGLLLKNIQKPAVTHVRGHIPAGGLTTRAYTEDEVKNLLAVAYPEEAIVVLLALEAGLTVSQISGLKRMDVEIDPEVRLFLRKHAGSVENQEPDGSDEIAIPLSPQLSSALKTWIDQTPGRSEHQPLTASPSQTSLSGKFRALCQRAGVPVLGLRGLRVTAGVRAFQRNGSLSEVASVLRLNSRQQAQAYAQAAELLESDKKIR